MAESGSGVLGTGQPAPSPSARSLESAVSSSVESGSEPQPKLDLAHFSGKIWHVISLQMTDTV